MKRYSSRQVRRILGKYEICHTQIEVAEDLRLNMAQVADPYALLDRMIEQEGRLHRVERFPYWAELWPASLALARWFCRAGVGAPASGARELGCGLGLVGIVLARLGWQIEATDFVEDALIFTCFNAQSNIYTAHIF